MPERVLASSGRAEGVAFGMASSAYPRARTAVARPNEALREGGGVVARVNAAVAAALRDAPRLVLAISGGRDSMVLLDAVAREQRDRVACMATFDHGTGEAASRAAALVEREARARGIPVHTGRAVRPGADEAAWRDARWSFLREVARGLGEREGELCAVATAHTRDDQVETVLMRALRGAGARGLAALYADGDVIRPLLEVPRADIALYADARALEWVEDPSNESRRHFRNRVRLDLLPALERARPGLSEELLVLARRAAMLRAELDHHVAANIPARVGDGELTVARVHLLDYDAEGLRMLWPTLAARLGATLDRRGTERIAEFTITGGHGGRIQLSGGYEVVLHRGTVVLRRAFMSPAQDEAVELTDGLAMGGWRFRRLWSPEGMDAGGDPHVAALPADRPLSVRSWRPGDRMTPSGASGPRRVKGLLRDAGIDAVSRIGWPVVLAEEELVWIPGVRRGVAATARSGRPVALYVCERDDNC